MYEDLEKRNNKAAPYVDLYIAGFPCQPFSTAGIGQGFGDKRGRGEVFFGCLDYIKKQKPRVFILENVSGLTKKKMARYLEAIMHELKNLRIYNVQWKLLDTKDHGVPQSRRRWYCIGILKEHDNGTFEFPEPIERPPIEMFLDPRDSQLAHQGLPPRSQSTARGNVIDKQREIRREGGNPAKDSFIVDCDSSAGRAIKVKNCSPCITCSRGAGHWVTNRGRRLLKPEMMRLQGMDPTNFTVAVSECQLGKQLGNTMSVNVLERLFTRLLPAAKLVRRGLITDRWASGAAVKKLARTRGQGFKEVREVSRIARKRSASSQGSSEPATKRRR
jgi:DNA (cytosine-5)-methyltransferase 1